MKKLFFLCLVCAAASACTSVSTNQVGGKDIVHITKMNIQILNNGGAPVSACIDALSDEKVQRVISASGAPTGGLFGFSRSIATIGLDTCNAVGEK